MNERKAMVKWHQHNKHLTIKDQADLLSINRTGLYWTAKAVSEREVEIKHLIDSIHTQYPFKGSRAMTADINNPPEIEYRVNRKRTYPKIHEGNWKQCNLSRS